jgi:hypothetical protein
MPSVKTSRWYSGGVIGVVLGVSLAWACASPAPENTPDPCAVLTAECPYCTDPTAKETCDNAVATSDDVQCTVALDDTGVIATCVVPDGGSDAPFVSTTDAPPLPACDAAQVLPDAGCTCSPPCVTTCPGGGCTIDCPPDAACLGSCNGGGCIFKCAAGATCTDSCDGGDCSCQCENDSVCNDTCATTPACVGP